MQVNNNNNSSSYNPIQHETSIKKVSGGKPNYEFLEVLWAGPTLALIKLLPIPPRVMWTLFSVTLGGAFVHGTMVLNKSFNNFAEDDPNKDYNNTNNKK